MGTSWGPRGRCPRCGSGDVQHIVLGMPLPDEMLGAPDWVVFAGCVVESEDDRACESCGTRWVARRRKKPQDG